MADVGFGGTPRRCTAGPVPFTLWSGEVAGLPVSVYAPVWSRAVVPAGAEGLPFLAVLDEIVERFRPHLALTDAVPLALHADENRLCNQA